MNYYVKPSGRTAEFVLRDAKKQKLSSVVGTQKGLEPIKLDGISSSYPMYELITVGGITEVIEHRRMEPVFYIAEDSKILTKLGVSN